MALTLISTANQFNSQDHPLNQTDIKNRAGKELKTALLVEHDASCKHATTGACVSEVGTYTGDTNTNQTISLSNSDLTPFMTLVWEDDTNFPYLRLSNMDILNTYTAAFTNPWPPANGCIGGASWYNTVSAHSTTGIRGEDAGEFTVGSSLNTNTTTYYYWVLGTASDQTFAEDAGGNPTYIQHAAALLGGNAATMANSVEDHIYDEIDDEHNPDTGAHDTFPIGTYYELGAHASTNADDTDIILTDSDLTIDALLIISAHSTNDTWVYPYVSLKTSSMAGDTTFHPGHATISFKADFIQDLGTGEFQVGESLNDTEAPTYCFGFVYLALGTH